MFAWCIHAVLASSIRPAAVPQREGQQKKADKKSKIHVGARKTEGSRWATSQHFPTTEMPGIHMLLVWLRTASKFCYGLLRRPTVTFCCVHPAFYYGLYYVSHTHRDCRGRQEHGVNLALQTNTDQTQFGRFRVQTTSNRLNWTHTRQRTPAHDPHIRTPGIVVEVQSRST